MFVPFSCWRRCLCASCHQKRSLIFADQVAHEICAVVPHRQYVLTVPKRLRIFFRFDRRLLGQLMRLACPALNGGQFGPDTDFEEALADAMREGG